MSVQPRPWPKVPEQAVSVARAAFPKGTWAMRVRDELPGLFADEHYAAAFGARGRPGISPGQLALVTVLQFVENLTDRQAADAVRARIDWKYALGLELSDSGFDHTVLTGFRQRLIDHGLEQTVLDLLLTRCQERGLLTARGRQRTDSTQVLAAVRSANRLEFLAETLRAALEALAAVAPDWLATRIDADWVARYGARMDSSRVPQGDDKRKQMVVQVGTDGFDLLEASHSVDAPVWLAEIPAVVVLRTVWLKQYHRSITQGEQVAERGAPSEVEIRLRVTIAALKKTIANKNVELAQLRADVPALVRAVNQLTLENQELRDALANPAPRSSRFGDGGRATPRIDRAGRCRRTRECAQSRTGERAQSDMLTAVR